MMDAGISYDEDDKPYQDGTDKEVWIMDPAGTDKPFIGRVWPGYVVFPDWLNPNSYTWWIQQLKEFKEKINFDGLWTDMNEASNFYCTGACLKE
jgi:alpha-glucosidase